MLPTSYRFRLPLSLIVASVISIAGFSALLLLQTYGNIQEDQRRFAERLFHVLAPSLSTALRHDDVWTAYSLLRGPEVPEQADPGRFLVLLDDRNRVFASDQPAVFGSGDELPGGLRERVANAPAPPRQTTSNVVHTASGNLMVASLESDNVFVGRLLVGFPSDVFWDRFMEIARGGIMAVLVMLAVLVPLGWIWGKRMVAPLANLERCMSLVGREPPDLIVAPAYSGDDEIARLGHGFDRMLKELVKNQGLERQVIAQERLAAIGRLTSGVAHEINNPLAGVMVALDTFKKKVKPSDSESHRTIDLIDRGLRQIQETVSALLVECRLENRSLLPHDIDDIHVLLSANEASQDKQVRWENGLSEAVPIPATPIRQIVLNLALNAVQSAWARSLVSVSVHVEDDHLHINVGDDGPPIPRDIIDHLFEPFESHRPGGTGLGLWITYETIRQLGGTISVSSHEHWTEFKTRIPL